MKYLPTPADHLPAGYPLPSKEESARYDPIWTRAFEIHRSMHYFPVHTHSEYILTVIPNENGSYCDCYEIAYQQLKHIL